MSLRIAVIGAGLSGLSAAVHARAGGADVQVVDAGPCGGLARTVEPIPGWKVELGPHTFTSRSACLFELIGALGLHSEVIPLSKAGSARYLRRGGKLRANVWALRLVELLSLIRGLFSRAASSPEASIREWAAARFGTRVADHVVGAMVTGIWAAQPDELEMASAFPMVESMVRTLGSPIAALLAARNTPRSLPAGTWTINGGLGRIGECAERHLCAGRVRENAESLVPQGSGWLVRTQSGSIGVDRVILALPANRSADLLGTLVPGAAGTLSRIRYSPIVAAHWLGRNCRFPDGFGYLASAIEAAPVLGMLFTSNLFPERVPAGFRGGVTLLGGTREPQALALSDDEIRTRILSEHQRLTGAALDLESIYVVRHPRAVAIPAPGHASLRTAAHAALPAGLFLAGAWDGSGAMEDAARSGRNAAFAALEAA